MKKKKMHNKHKNLSHRSKKFLLQEGDSKTFVIVVVLAGIVTLGGVVTLLHL